MKNMPGSHAHEHQYLLDRLQSLLEQQMQLLRNGKFREMDIYVDQAGSILADIQEKQILNHPHFKDQGDNIVNIYRQLILMIESEKDMTCKNIHKVANGKKTVRAYNNQKV